MSVAKVCAIVVAFTVVGCGAGRYPSAFSQRPLNLPAGHHQLIVGGGVEKLDRDSAGLNLDLGYRYGITDAIGIELPLVFACGGPVADNLELQGQLGLEGFGNGATQTSKHYRVDPRYRISGHEDLYGLFGVRISARTMLGESAALRLGAASTAYGGGRFYRPSLSGSASLSYELGSFVSLNLGVSFGLSNESPSGIEDRQVAVLGIGNVGNAFGPLVELHLADELDVYGSSSWVFNLKDEVGEWNATAGIDWHFD